MSLICHFRELLQITRVISGIHWGTHVAIAFGQLLQSYGHLQNTGYLENLLNYPLVALHLLNTYFQGYLEHLLSGIAFVHPSHLMGIC